MKLDELTPRLMDKFYQSLLKVKTKVVQNKKPKNEYLTVHTVREIHKFLRSAFNQAVKWELMTRNPVLNATLPKEEHQNRALKKLIQDNDLPDVVFHSFRHASITYKLKWNGGDMKSVQGDSGHARMDMVADVYSHIIDEDRRYNAQKFEEQFYNAKGLKNAEEGKTAPMPKFETSVELLDPMAEVQKESEVEKEKPAENSTDENAALLTKLLSNPETAALLKALAKTI